MRKPAQGSVTEHVRRVVDRITPERWAQLPEARQFCDESACRQYVRECLNPGSQHLPQTVDVRAGEVGNIFVANVRAYAAACCSSFRDAERLYFVRLTVLSSLVHVLEDRRDNEEALQSLVDREPNGPTSKIIRNGLSKFHEGIRKLVASGWNEFVVTEMWVLFPVPPSYFEKVAPHWDKVVECLNDQNPDQSRETSRFPFTYPDLVDELRQFLGVPDKILSRDQIRSHLGYEPMQVVHPTPAGRSQSFTFVNQGHPDPQTRSGRSKRRRPNNATDNEPPIATKLPKQRSKPRAAPSVTPRSHGEAALTDVSPGTIPMRSRRESVMKLSQVVNYPEVEIFATLFIGPKDTLWREEHLLLGTTEQQRLDGNGFLRYTTLADAASEPSFKALFIHAQAVRDILRSSQDVGKIVPVKDKNGQPAYRLKSDDNPLPCGEASSWNGLRFLCHIFPRDGLLSDAALETAKQLVAVVMSWTHLLSKHPSLHLPPDVHEAFCDVCVAAASVGNSAQKRAIFQFSMTMCRGSQSRCSYQRPEHLRLALAHLESCIWRNEAKRPLDENEVRRPLDENLDESDKIIEAAIATTSGLDKTKGLARLPLARLYFSKAENLMLQKKPGEACGKIEEVAKSLPSVESLSMVQLRIHFEMSTLFGRLYRYDGRFAEAEEVLRLALGFSERLAIAGHTIRRNLADVYCERGKFNEVVGLIKPTVEDIKERGKQKTALMMSAPLADAYYQLGHSKSACALWTAIDDFFERNSAVGNTEELTHLRAHLNLLYVEVRNLNYDGAIDRAERCLRTISDSSSFRPDNHYKGTVLRVKAACSSLKAVCLSRKALEDVDEANRCQKGPYYFIPLHGTVRYDDFSKFTQQAQLAELQKLNREGGPEENAAFVEELLAAVIGTVA